ncbi:putative translation initiation factor E2B gamma subunit [Encephalitozoon intestinalis ATCC 50506]|uniref:Translation initiation factor eIF2B subunit gamma n=1 Tax=Encephalitozoon intestinalis (strain ATCC 50506) TaxID=876142 RepID=E0S703_ENCIT|nr:putative translation initiation factor E2B gamma subunit [Encephalitozoon intestinalis ATCC 50506]ADM11589.1 putative translation initiation factor E2B gamma subunit [Encephalitozoon intestinalis ATCC 50506]UTX45307.1 initiation factor E2B subunit epsilon [Encephalitozoon intestinalis]
MFEIIILIGPGTELFPIVNEKFSKACLPIMNSPMILHTMECLKSVSKRFFVVGLNEEKEDLMSALGEDIDVPVEYVGIDTYDGTVASLLSLYPRITSNDVLVCKGDIVTNMDIQAMAFHYFDSKKALMVILGNAVSETSILGYKGDDLMFYSNDCNEEIPFHLLKKGLTLTKDLDILQFYMLKTSLFKMFKPDYFSFKHDLLPNVVKNLALTNPVGIHRPGKSYIYQIRSISNYLSVNALLKRHSISTDKKLKTSESNAKFIKDYVKKYNLKDLSNVIDNNTKTGNVLLLDSIIGRDCDIGEESKIISSIVMSSVSIGHGSHIEGSIIGMGATILPGSVLINCKVSPGYTFTEVVNADTRSFSK